MTKAMTVGAKRRRGGRHRSQTPREPSGRIQREHVLDTMRPTLEARCKMMGWPVDESHMRRARAQHLLTVWGRLWEAGEISEGQHEAAEKLYRLASGHRRALGAPSPFPKCPTMGEATGGSTRPLSASEADMLREAYDAAMRALLSVGQEARDSVMGMMDNPTGSAHLMARKKRLRAGLTALGDHFGIAEYSGRNVLDETA